MCHTTHPGTTPQAAAGAITHRQAYPDPDWHGHLVAVGVTEWHRHPHAEPSVPDNNNPMPAGQRNPTRHAEHQETG